MSSTPARSNRSQPSSPGNAPGASALAVAGCATATIAFWAYTRTLLPGVDLGDTGGFQAAVLWPEVSARQAYPLYYALARPFVGALAAAQPARGLNLFSAVWAALAVGVLTGLTGAVARSLLGGATAGLLLAFSYTFWTQAIIAEVYSLHLALVGCCLVALAAYAARPGTRRLTVFFAVYALSFGNHLSMILLFVPFTLFLLMTTPDRRDLIRPAVIGLAAGTAAAGALQYLPNLLAVWRSPDAPAGWADRLAAFWFDVTKADWRESMVFGVTRDDLAVRLSFAYFDTVQQFGVDARVLGLAGVIALWRTARPWAVLLASAWAINTAFAFTYNVGDPHVFFLPGHYFEACAIGCLIGARPRRSYGTAGVALIVCAGYVSWRAYDTWPAADRHDDRRAMQIGSQLTAQLDERSDLLVTSLNWQIENVLLYETRYRARQVAWTRLPDVMLHFPLLVRDNHAAGRDVVLAGDAAARVGAAFGPLFPLVPDPVPPAPPLLSRVEAVPRGTWYVLARLTPPRDESLDEGEVAAALHVLTGGAVPSRTGAPYEIVVGAAGSPPIYYRTSTRPFRARLPLPDGMLDIRLDGWVPLETFRRGGYGHVLLDRRRVLFLERGLSFAVLGTAEPFYAGGLYAPRPRVRIPARGVPRLALLH